MMKIFFLVLEEVEAEKEIELEEVRSLTIEDLDKWEQIHFGKDKN